MGAGNDYCPECERLLASYIEQLRAMSRHSVEESGESAVRLQSDVQRLLGSLLRHEYAHASQRRRGESREAPREEIPPSGPSSRSELTGGPGTGEGQRGSGWSMENSA